MSSLSKMLSVLDLFSPQTLKVDPETIAERMGLSRATVYRYVKDLCDSGILVRVDAGSYGLGPRIIELDWMMRQYDPILIAGRELMHELSQETGLAVFASVFYDGRIINTYIAEPTDTYQFSFGRGQPLPFFRGAQSKVLIAHQKGRRLQRLFEEHLANDPTSPYDWDTFSKATRKIRKDGYCVTHDELNLGLTGIAAPIIGSDSDEILGSLAAVGTSTNFQLLRQEAVTERVMETARRIAANMQ
ncbi:IclR family transcriptional regulator [Pseudomonas juntendi]|uniref:HTH-type transcriptional repressor AllR n=1 Tax=Pseudomonas juntendi TaxID=2666183 RepID=A0ABD4YA63_9PSED|nr:MULTISPECIES: IclR family transcriptional regulator [Pseudomonas]MDH0756173.1 IclR family transcriptional regulator [Pseudomonas juntendi]MDH1919857.1 IclR family transcriptional regulator [Pseudomonas juntendi]RRV65054.1 IclR family transcriptional regulator [Pseudomonas sp. p99-361]SUD79734.1 IclR family transcriptional regulator [Pseudomonas putida]